MGYRRFFRYMNLNKVDLDTTTITILDTLKITAQIQEIQR